MTIDHNITIYETHQQMNNNNDNNNGEKLSSLWQSGILSEILEICKDCIIVRNEQEEASNNNGGCKNNKLPWLVQNVEGNTPLHEAVIVKNRHLVVQLLKYNNNMSADVLFNKRRDTPLHLLAGASAYHHDGKERFNTEEVNLMAGGNEEAVFSLDRDGLTPILRAFRAGNLAIAATLCNISPEAAMISDKDGNTFLHLLVKHPSKYHLYCLLQNEALRSVWKKGDNKGNTALHLAINDSRFDIVQMFLDAAALDNQKLSQWLVDLLEIQNKAHKTPADLISDSPCLPSKIEESIWYEPKLLGVRSRWGVPTSQIKTYMNTVGVIAVLLATITFTAAFTIANAISKDIFDNEQELSMISHKIPFKLFMISDVTAMCLSMMVLVCLLKIMATNNKRDAIITLDFSIGLLRASFITTLITFMAILTMAMFNTLPDITVITVTLCLIVSLFLLNFGTMDMPMYVKLVVSDFTNLLFIIMSTLCRSNLRRKANVEGTVRQIDTSNNV